MNRFLPTVFALFLTATLAHAWNARYAPEDSNVSWPTPENPTDRATNLFSHELLGNSNILVGDVQVSGETGTRSFLAKLDDAGDVVWSRRIPSTKTESLRFNLVQEDTVIVAYQSDNSGADLDILGNFDPTSGFSSRYAKSVPSLATDPFNPLASGSRSYQSQGNGDVAIVQIEANKINVLMVNASGAPRFQNTYTMPAGGGGLPFPIPGFGTSYMFATIWNLENGDYYLTTNGVDLQTQSATAYILRLSDSGNILWQAGVSIPGSTAVVTPLLDDRLAIAGGGGGGPGSISSSIVILTSEGELDFAKSIPNTIMAGNSFLHYSESGNFLFSGTLPTSFTEFGYTSDGVALVLSSTGEKLAETAYDLGDSDSITHIGTTTQGLYFELYGFSTESGEITQGIIARSDENLENWITRSYLDSVGPSAILSTFFSEGNNPFLSFRDENQDWIYVNELGPDLQEIGDCEVLADIVVPFYDPNLNVNSLTPTINRTAVSASPWANAPILSNFAFVLEENPLTVEAVCGDTGGGGDPVSLWDDVAAANAEGDKKAGIGWVNDVAYPYIWHYSTGGWMYILDDFSDLQNIYGWDYVNQFWFWANNGWGGWYVNLENPEWGIAGWAKWE